MTGPRHDRGGERIAFRVEIIGQQRGALAGDGEGGIHVGAIPWIGHGDRSGIEDHPRLEPLDQAAPAGGHSPPAPSGGGPFIYPPPFSPTSNWCVLGTSWQVPLGTEKREIETPAPPGASRPPTSASRHGSQAAPRCRVGRASQGPSLGPRTCRPGSTTAQESRRIVVTISLSRRVPPARRITCQQTAHVGKTFQRRPARTAPASENLPISIRPRCVKRSIAAPSE